MKNKGFIPWIVVIFLAITFSLSFLKNNTKENRKATKTALLNPKYKESLSNIILYNNSNAIELNFNNNFWTITNPSNPENKLPADNQKVLNLIEQLTKVSNMYKISDSLNTKNDFGLQDLTAFHIIYYTNTQNNSFTDLIFGKHDFTQQYRYFMTGNSSQVYEIDTSYDSFLSSKVSSWNEGLIISKNIIKNNDIQRILITDFIENKSKSIKTDDKDFFEYSNRLLELRQGGFPDNDFQLNEMLLSINIAFGNLDEVILKVYPSSKEGEYLLQEIYHLSNSSSYEYVTKISSWTLSKLQ